MEIYPVLNWLYPETFATEREFIGAYCIARNGLFKLQNEMRTRMVYRTQAEVLKLPKATNREASIPLEDAQRVEYNKKAQNFIASLEERGELSDTKMKLGAFVLQKLHDLRREAVEAKYLDALTIVAQARRKGEKVVLYTTYVEVARKLQEMLREYQPMLLTGVTRSAERRSLVKEFASSSERGVFIITAAGGESVDLTPANHFVFLNKPLTYADQEQAVKRVMRRGQRRSVTVHHLTAADTIDERIESLLQRKRAEFERVFQRDKQISRWFRDNERENVKELVREYIEHEKKKGSRPRRSKGGSK
jgi:SNF2 family DNA or RNA helicase